jgi:hypothetical protein
MDRYYDIDPSNGRYSEEKSHHIRERYTSSSRRHRHTAPRAAGKGAWVSATAGGGWLGGVGHELLDEWIGD